MRANGIKCGRQRQRVRLNAVGAARFSAAAWATDGFDRSCAQRALLPIAQVVQKGKPGPETAGNLANVG